MTYKAHIRNGAVVLDEPIPLPDGTALEIQAVEAPVSLGELMRDVTGKGRELPADGAEQHDHYIYGTPKK